MSHITNSALQNHIYNHQSASQGNAHAISKSQIVAPDANHCTEAKCQRALDKAASIPALDFKII
jgi:hypothetical protein